MTPEQEINQIVNGYRATVVKEMTVAAGLQDTKRKNSNARDVSKKFASAQYLEKAIQELNEWELLVLAYFQARPGRVGVNRLRRMFYLSKPESFTWPGVGKTYQKASPHYEKKRTKPKPYLEDVLARLAQKGLVFSFNPQADKRQMLSWSPGPILLVSPAFRPYLKKLDLPTLPDAAEKTPPFVVRGSARRFQRDISRLARFVRRKGTVNLTTQGLIYKSDLREVADELSFYIDVGSGKNEKDSGQLYFMRRLLPTIGLASQPYGLGSDLSASDDASFWQASLAERVQRCFEAWRDQNSWHELLQLNHYESGINWASRVPQSLIDARTAVLEYVPQSANGWLSVGDLVDDMREENYGFLFPQRTFRNRYYSWYGNQTEETVYEGHNNEYRASFSGIKNEKDGWNKVEADLINHIIVGPLFWLGLVDLGYENEPPSDRLGNQPATFYRLTPYGQWLLNAGEKPTSEVASGGTVLIQPNFEVTFMGPVSDETLMQLDVFAIVTQEQEYAVTYKLTKQSVYDGMKEGWPPNRILTYLEELSHKPVPQNVRRSLEEWGALQERIVVRRGVQLIHTADKSVADEIASQPAFAIWRRVGDNVFLTVDAPETILKTLDEARWLPLHTAADTTTAVNSISLSAAGDVTFIQPTPSIYASQVLQSLTAETDHGRALTEPLVKTAVQEQSLETVLAMLQQIHKGPLPAALVIKIKAWSDYYGAASLGNITLVEFGSPQIRDEMLADEEIGIYLSPFPAHDRALAIVHPEHVETVRDILLARRVELTTLFDA